MGMELSSHTRRWAASFAATVVLVAMVFVLLRVPRVPTIVETHGTAEKVPSAAVEVAPLGGSDRTLEEATVMHDQTPLFLPTERNVALKPLAPIEAGGSLLARDLDKLSFGPRELTLTIPTPTAIPANPIDAVLTGGAPAPLHGFGRVDTPVLPLPARGAWVEVFSMRDNARVLAHALPITARPPVEKAWRPMEFAAAVEPAGLVGSLTLTERSDVEEVERYFRIYLAQTFRIGERLPPGFYRIVVGP